MDVSGSTSGLYRSGAMQAVAAKAFVTALHWDDDGEVPFALFDHDLHVPDEPMTLDNYDGYVDRARRGLRGGTNYSKALRWCREAATVDGKKRGRFSFSRHNAVTAAPLPTYVMFVTDGEPQDSRRDIVNEMIAASHEPVFFQFIGVGVGKGRPGHPSFPFLEKLDEMDGRILDNANFFAVEDPTAVNDEWMFERLLAEYPAWVPQARQHGLLAS